MSGRLEGGPVTVSGTAQNLTTGLGMATRRFFSDFTLRASATNGGTVYFGKSNVTTSANQLGFLQAGDAWGGDLTQKFISSDDFFVVGTPGDVVFVTIIS